MLPNVQLKEQVPSNAIPTAVQLLAVSCLALWVLLQDGNTEISVGFRAHDNESVFFDCSTVLGNTRTG